MDNKSGDEIRSEGAVVPATAPERDIDRWVRELEAAGWHRYRGMATVWEAPNHALYLGPAGAWIRMKAGIGRAGSRVRSEW